MERIDVKTRWTGAALRRPLLVLFLVALVLRVGVATFTGLNTP
jgi:hypothetical protein